MEANEEMIRMGYHGCDECHCGTEHDEWEYLDYTSKSVIKCPQCSELYYTESLLSDEYKSLDAGEVKTLDEWMSDYHESHEIPWLFCEWKENHLERSD